jgi:hypothetical protein
METKICFVFQSKRGEKSASMVKEVCTKSWMLRSMCQAALARTTSSWLMWSLPEGVWREWDARSMSTTSTSTMVVASADTALRRESVLCMVRWAIQGQTDSGGLVV